MNEHSIFLPPLSTNWTANWSEDEIGALQRGDHHLGDIVLHKIERNYPPDKEIFTKANEHTQALYRQW